MRITHVAAACALAGSALASLPARATPCTPEALGALHVPDVTISDAHPVAATAATPAHCRVEGSVVTRGEGAPDGSARFALELPDAWQHRFLFMGNGGNAGSLVPSINATDRAEALAKGYATAMSDTGHGGGTFNAAWVLDPQGHRDQAKVTDFFFRATHDATEAGKHLVQAYYAAPIAHAYFDGCSTGGRMSMMEAERYPQDYDGAIAGDPAMDYRSNLTRLAVQKQLLGTSGAWLPPALVAVVDRAITQSCDAADGTQDGLIQDPRQCRFRPESLLCRPGQTADCLTPAQVQTLATDLQPVRDTHGALVYPALPVANLSGPTGLSLWGIGKAPPDLAHPAAPWADDPDASPEAWLYGRQLLTYWLGLGQNASFTSYDIDPRTGIVGDAALAAFDRAYDGINTADPGALLPFLRSGRKIILYHGFSDPGISPYRTITFMDALAGRTRGEAAGANAALFLVPGMHHCRGGEGPNQFDTLGALERWVEAGVAPDAIPARSAPEQVVQRSMPLCRYPEEAQHRGPADVLDAASWSCSAAHTLPR